MRSLNFLQGRATGVMQAETTDNDQINRYGATSTGT